jgi:hypothetical protein
MTHAIAIVICSAMIWAMGLWSALIGAENAALVLCGIGVALLYASVGMVYLIHKANP